MMPSISTWPEAVALVVIALCSLAKSDSPITRAIASRFRRRH